TITFFFSSRRRHTRLQGDWSSDVCSSDLARPMSRLQHKRRAVAKQAREHRGLDKKKTGLVGPVYLSVGLRCGYIASSARLCWSEIGRASCRERVWIAVAEWSG